MTHSTAPEVWIEPRTLLEGKRVLLEPVSESHLDPLWKAANFPEIWTWVSQPIMSRQDMAQKLQWLKAMREKGLFFSFAVQDKASGEWVGSTSYLNIDQANRRVEIGYTWLTPRWQGTYVNTENKFLMLEHAFERLGCIRVEFKTHVLNAKSRAALKRIGAVEEGVFRKHMILGDGRTRDSAYFSIVDDEWPAVKEKLLGKINVEGGHNVGA